MMSLVAGWSGSGMSCASQFEPRGEGQMTVLTAANGEATNVPSVSAPAQNESEPDFDCSCHSCFAVSVVQFVILTDLPPSPVSPLANLAAPASIDHQPLVPPPQHTI